MQQHTLRYQPHRTDTIGHADAAKEPLLTTIMQSTKMRSKLSFRNTQDPSLSQAATGSRRRRASSGCLKLQEPTSVLPMYPASF